MDATSDGGPSLDEAIASLEAERTQAVERVNAAKADVAELRLHGTTMESDEATFRRILSGSAATVRFWIGDRYAMLGNARRLVKWQHGDGPRWEYPEESMWTDPPMWNPDSTVLGYVDEILLPHPTMRFHQVINWVPAAPSHEAIGRLHSVIDGLSRLPSNTRSKLVQDWALADAANQGYSVRTGSIPTTWNYEFASLLVPGPLYEMEAELVAALLRGYCNAAMSRSSATKQHPYQVLKRDHLRASIVRAQITLEMFEEDLQRVENALNVARRRKRILRKREILASGLNFQDELAGLLATQGYECTPLPKKDRGIDLLTTKRGVRIGIQAKKHAKPVGSTFVRELRGAREEHRLDAVVLVSSSTFTRDARVAARVQPAVVLVSLEDLLERLDLGEDPLFIKR